jgi:hypothetical protein
MTAQSRRMKVKSARKVLLSVWLGFFFVNMGMVLFFYLGGWIGGENFKLAMKQVSSVYAPYLGLMLLFYWGKAKKGSGGVKVGLSFWLALVGSVIWNGVIFLFIFFQYIEDAVANIRDIGGLLAWLVAGAIGYYFAQES